MKKINKLTPEQEASIPAFVKKYVDIGLSTQQCSRKETQQIINNLYTKIFNYPANVPLIILRSPLEAYCGTVLCYNLFCGKGN